jgi:hypothetical protein
MFDTQSKPTTPVAKNRQANRRTGEGLFTMSRTNQLLCAHSALVFAILLGLGIFGIAGWMPLIDPGMSAADLALEFQEKQMAHPARDVRSGIRVSLLVDDVRGDRHADEAH